MSSTGLGPSLLGSSLCPPGESGGRLEPGFLGCRVLGGVSGSWAKPLSPLYPQSLQSLLRQCRSLSHLSLAGTDCPLDAVSTWAGSPGGEPPPLALLPKPLGGAATPSQLARGCGDRRVWGDAPCSVPAAGGGLGDFRVQQGEEGTPSTVWTP